MITAKQAREISEGKLIFGNANILTFIFEKIVQLSHSKHTELLLGDITLSEKDNRILNELGYSVKKYANTLKINW